MTLTLSHNTGHSADSHGSNVYADLLMDGAFSHQKIVNWTTSIEGEALAEIVDEAIGGSLLYSGWDTCSGNGLHDIVRQDDRNTWICRVTFRGGSFYTSTAAKRSEVLAEVITALEKAVPVAHAEDHTIPVRFWALGKDGPLQFYRPIHVPQWDEVEDNYATETHRDLTPLMDGFTPSRSGQLILWSGPPGTGKTFALRAMGWAWRDWADFHYISDPEVFFGERSSYMLQILTAESEDDRWRLLILEDSGELLAADAKERTGQGLSRLLNVVDGLIGQGLKIMVLITTNDELKKMHPAVTRPGRCAAIVDFGLLNPEEVESWADTHGLIDVDTTKQWSVAQLYAQKEGYYVDEHVQAVGFGS